MLKTILALGTPTAGIATVTFSDVSTPGAEIAINGNFDRVFGVVIDFDSDFSASTAQGELIKISMADGQRTGAEIASKVVELSAGQLYFTASASGAVVTITTKRGYMPPITADNSLSDPSVVAFVTTAGVSGGCAITNSDPTVIYFSNSGVISPDLATNWKNSGNDSPASITVTSATQGEIDAGQIVSGAGTANANDVYPVTGNNAGKNSYTGIAHALVLQWTGTAWKINNTSPQSATNSKLPSGATFNDSATVARDDVASEQNWQVVR